MTNLNLDAFVADLEGLRSEAEKALVDAVDIEGLEAARVVFLGAKNGRLKAVQKGLGKLDREDKPVGGQQFNAVKKSVEVLFLQASQYQHIVQVKKDIPLPLLFFLLKMIIFLD